MYGYRPLPDREYKRFWGTTISFNNLSLRSEADWDSNKQNKILFLGDSVTYGGSYISNLELFSFLSVKKLKNKFISGNAGVNGWGVENVFGLIVEKGFTPAKIYVSVFPELDFYRGLTRLQGLPFFNTSPKYAMKELWLYFCYKQNNFRYKNWQNNSDELTKKSIVEKAIKKLKQMDEFLRDKGYIHTIFISPTKKQLMKQDTNDITINDLMQKYQLSAYYIEKEIGEIMNLSDKEKMDCYHDNVHLSKFGHKIWADAIISRLSQVLRLKLEKTN